MANAPLATPPLQDFIDRHDKLFVLTGAGCSTNSGIPDYRDSNGNWKRTQPVNTNSLSCRSMKSWSGGVASGAFAMRQM